MTQFTLPCRERRLLEALVAQTTDATVLRRGQALLWWRRAIRYRMLLNACMLRVKPSINGYGCLSSRRFRIWRRAFKPRLAVDAPVQ